MDLWKVAFLLVFSLVIISLSNMEGVLALNGGKADIFGYLVDYSAALIVMTLPVYIHAELNHVKRRSLKDKFFIGLSLFLCIMLTIGFILDIQKINDLIFSFVIVVMSGSVIYSQILLLLDPQCKKKSGSLEKILGISVIFLIPLMIWIDFMNNQLAGFIVLPLMYLNINVLMIISEIDDLLHTGTTEMVSMERMVASGLTKREQEQVCC